MKEVYRALDLEAAFRAYEQESYEALVGLIEGQDLLPQVGRGWGCVCIWV